MLVSSRGMEPPKLDDIYKEFFDEEPPEYDKGMVTPRSRNSHAIAAEVKYDALIEEIIAGTPVGEANRKVGYANDSIPPSARFREKLEQRRAEYRERLSITPENVLREYSRIAFFDIRNLVDDNGNPIPVQDLDEDTAAAIAGIDIQKLGKEEGWAEVLKYKIESKAKALEALGRSLNLFKEDNERGLNVTMKDVTPRERARRIAYILQEAAGRQATPDSGEQ